MLWPSRYCALLQNTVRFIPMSEKTPCFIANFICRGRHHLREDQGRRAACLLLQGVSHRGLRRVLLLEQTQQRMRLCPWKTVELLLPGRKEIKTLTNLSRFPNLGSLPCTSYLTAAPPSASLVVRAFCNFHNYWLNSQNGGGRVGYSL